MKSLVILFTVVLLAGCTDKNIDSMSKAKQDFACKDKGGVYKYVTVLHRAHCMDGDYVDRWSHLILPKEFYPKTKETSDERNPD